MPKRFLRNIHVGEVSLVDKAANRRRFLLLKAAGHRQPQTEPPATGGEKMPETMSQEQLVAALQNYDGDRTELLKSAGITVPEPEPTPKADEGSGDTIANLDARIEKLEKADGGSESETVTLLKALRSDLIDEQTRREKLEKSLADERNERITREYVTKAEEFDGLEGEPEEIAATLRAVDENLPEEEAEKVTKALKEASDLRKDSHLTTRISKDGDAEPGDAFEALQGIAVEIRKADMSLTEAQAFEKAWADPANADLRRQYNEERIQR
jgi:hypothetical protein